MEASKRAPIAPFPGAQACDNPGNLVALAYVSQAHGIRGALKIESYSGRFDSVSAGKSIFLEHAENFWRVKLVLLSVRVDHAILTLEGLTDRDVAHSLRSGVLHIPRDELPSIDKADEHYWLDLVGCQVINRSGVSLGEVSSLISTGVHDVLCIAAPATKSGERMIPFVSAYVHSVHVDEKKIVVDWQPEWDDS